MLRQHPECFSLFHTYEITTSLFHAYEITPEVMRPLISKTVEVQRASRLTKVR